MDHTEDFKEKVELLKEDIRQHNDEQYRDKVQKEIDEINRVNEENGISLDSDIITQGKINIDGLTLNNPNGIRINHTLPSHTVRGDMMSQNVLRFNTIAGEMVDLYSRKNHDYGDSFSQSLDEDGLLVSKIRMGDKINRFNTLIGNTVEDHLVNDETLEDTLIDLANYAVMTIMWMRYKGETHDIENEQLSFNFEDRGEPVYEEKKETIQGEKGSKTE